MEIRINIPKNDYVQPTEVRENVVQAICDAFLAQCVWSTFHPFSQGCYRRADKYVLRYKRDSRFYGFVNSPFEGEDGITFNGAEMKAAFKALQEAGYYMFRIYEYGSWMGYKCSKKPFMEKGERVTEFNNFID